MTLLTQWRQSRLARMVSVAFTIQFLGYGVTFLLNIILARTLGAAAFGNFVFFKNTITIAAIFGTFGLFGAATKYLSSYDAAKAHDATRGFIAFSSGFTVVLSALLAGVVAVGLWFFPPPSLDVSLVMPFIPVLIVLALHLLYVDVLRGLQFIAEALAPPDLFRPLMMLILFLGFWQLSDNIPLVKAIDAFAISLVLVLICQLVIIAWAIDQRPQPTLRYPMRFELREWLAFSFESLVFRGNILLRTEFTPIIIAYLIAGDAVGLFVVAERASYLTAFLFNAVRRVFEPMIAPLYEAGNLEELNRIHIRITRWTFYVALIVTAILIAFADLFLGLFGQEFLAARPALIIMLIGQVINAATGQAGSILRFAGYEVQVRQIMLVTTTLMLMSTVTLTALCGILGTAIGVAGSVIFQNVAFYLVMTRQIGLTLPLRTFALFGRV